MIEQYGFIRAVRFLCVCKIKISARNARKDRGRRMRCAQDANEPARKKQQRIA